MGVYNSGGAASYRFSKYTIVVSRRHPKLLEPNQNDEIGITVVRYNELDPEKYKTGTYEYFTDQNGGIIRLNLENNELPFPLPKKSNIKFGTVFRHISYDLDKYSGRVDAPKQSLHSLLNASLPRPVLPIRIYGHREKEKAARGREYETRVIRGNMYRLQREGVSEYFQNRKVDLGIHGTMILHYHVIAHGKETASYVETAHALNVMHNGQRQITKPRDWVRRKTGMNFLHKRLILHLDSGGLTHQAKRAIFSSTRESGVDSRTLTEILDMVISELKEDENLHALDQADKDLALNKATAAMSKTLKKKLEKEVSMRIKGTIGGTLGGINIPKKRRKKKRPGKPIDVSDDKFPEIPTNLSFSADQINIYPGSRRTVILEINGKNGFVPNEGEIKFEYGGEVKPYVYEQSVGNLLGGKLRIVLQADIEAPIVSSDLVASLVIPNLGVNLSASTKLNIVQPDPEDPKKPTGGEPEVNVQWVKKEDHDWTQEDVGVCLINKGDDGKISSVLWLVNQDFVSWKDMIEHEDLTEKALTTRKDRYALPVCITMFRRQIDEDKEADKAEKERHHYKYPMLTSAKS